MGKEALNKMAMEAAVAKIMSGCVDAVTALQYGPDGPPADMTFAQMEAFGHKAGRMFGRAVDQELASQHAQHFQKTSACPTCQTLCEPKPNMAEREIQTSDGRVLVAEPVCHCSVCHRDFFPGAHSACH